MFLLIFVAVTGCQADKHINPTDTNFPTDANTTTPELLTTATLSSMTPTATLRQCVVQKTLVTDNKHSYLIGWSADGEALIFAETPDNGITRFQAYNIEDQSYSPQDVISPTPDVLKSYMDNLVAEDQISYFEYSISPTGDKALYIKKAYLSPTPTPDPMGGEGDWPNYVNVVYLVGMDLEPLRIGNVKGAVYDFVWFPDGQKVVIQLGRPDLGTYPTWIVDVNKKEIKPFKEDKEGAYFRDISPDGKWILYQFDKTLLVFNNRDNSDFQISDELYISGLLWWSGDSSKFLVVRTNTEPPDNILLYDLLTKQVLTIPNSDFMINTDAKPPALLSPDHSQLAYQEYKTNWIYVLELCLGGNFPP